MGRLRRAGLAGALVLAPLASAAAASAQVVPAGGGNVITVARGQSELVTQPSPVARVSIGDPAIADAVVVSPREVLVNGMALGTTTLILWDQAGNRRSYTVEVTVDASALQRTFRQLFPGESMQVTASGNIVILSGTVRDTRVARQAAELARSTGATVIDNLTAPPAQQVLLQVRIAQASRNAIKDISTLLRGQHVQDFTTDNADWSFESLSDGLLRILVSGGGGSLEAVFNALRTNSEVRMLAEPNLVALEGAEASFLAGGEFPFPVVQGNTGAVTIQWREFGVKLNFVPQITGAGNIRIKVAPEVSSLDFSTGLVVSGFAVPALLTRRAETEVELREGQTFAIAGLLDNNTLNSVTRIPILGDLPIIGELFRSRAARQDRTELIVLVTPRFVSASNQAPPVPTGEPNTWKWDGHLRPPTLVPGTTTVTPMQVTPVAPPAPAPTGR
jgi:pilus assembly protein CpaC